MAHSASEGTPHAHLDRLVVALISLNNSLNRELCKTVCVATYLPNSMQPWMTVGLQMAVPSEMRTSRSRVRGKAGSGLEEIDPQSDKETEERQLDFFWLRLRLPLKEEHSTDEDKWRVCGDVMRDIVNRTCEIS